MSEPPTTTVYEFTVPPGQHESIRLDVYITSFVENATRSKVQEAIKQGYVWVNGKHEKASYKMLPGDEIYIELPIAPPPEAVAEPIPASISENVCASGSIIQLPPNIEKSAARLFS